MHNPRKESFEKWWKREGERKANHYNYPKKELCEIAWSNGACKIIEHVEKNRKTKE